MLFTTVILFENCSFRSSSLFNSYDLDIFITVSQGQSSIISLLLVVRFVAINFHMYWIFIFTDKNPIHSFSGNYSVKFLPLLISKYISAQVSLELSSIVTFLN